MNRTRLWFGILGVLVLVGAVVSATPHTWAQETAAPDDASAGTPDAASTESAPELTLTDLKTAMDEKAIDLDTVWVLVTAFLVMWMQAGFALVETGLTRAKNSVNILMKNLMDFCFGTIGFWAVGFALMFGVGNAFLGYSGFFLADNAQDTVFQSLTWTSVPLEAKFFFQLVFAATAATIVSGAMAERTKFTSYMLYSIVISMLIYPISGHWIWGGGWLSTFGGSGFWDFAGSTVVHSVGGWIALTGALVLGPRLGKFTKEGKPRAIPGHNIPLATLGVFILWLGWFGFNPGSTMSVLRNDISHIVCTTNAAAAIGAIAAMITSKILFKKWEATMSLNGALAGLVAITCPCAWVSIPSSLIIGGAAGVLVVLSVLFIENFLKIDDPVGAISVHGVCGAFGTLSLGLFSIGTGDASPAPGLFCGGGPQQLINQAVGVGAVFAWSVVTGLILFFALKFIVGLRVSREEEMEGLDVGEHGNSAYHGFVISNTPEG